MVVWSRELYLRQGGHDHTQEHNERIRVVINDAIENSELPGSASNLIVDHPSTSRFYLLPKIHKPGNPGRPIVSDCNCPTELLATYLDQVTTPLVHGLPSFVKDTNHMIQISDQIVERLLGRGVHSP